MLYQELKRYLSDDERAAMDWLESIGYQIMTEARLDDCKKKDGSRVRTFSLRGRYDLMIGLKSVEGRDMSEEAEEAETVAVDIAETVQVEEAEELAAEEDDSVVGSNFWMDQNNWKLMNRRGFKALVLEEAIDDLMAAPVDVQEEVKKKFIRFFDESEWPLQ